MKTKLAAFLLIFLVSFTFLSFAENSDEKAKSFQQQIDQTMENALQGHFGQASADFEEMIKNNPDESIVYDLYAQILEIEGDFKKSIKIYQRALEREKIRTTHESRIKSRITALEDKIKFQLAMQQAIPWTQAKVSGNQWFILKTNIPEEYRKQIQEELIRLFKEETALLNTIFRQSLTVEEPITIYVSGRREDYQKILGEIDYPSLRIIPLGLYSPEQRKIIIQFDGFLDKGQLANLLAKYLIRRFVKTPSLFLEIGLSKYVSVKLEKSGFEDAIKENLEYLNWAYDQGQWENVLYAFDMVPKFDLPKGEWEIVNFEPWQKLGANYLTFSLRAWTLTFFFMTTKDPLFSTFFDQYLDYERNHVVNNEGTAKAFFITHLSQEDIQRLNQEWIKFSLSLNYEKI